MFHIILYNIYIYNIIQNILYKKYQENCVTYIKGSTEVAKPATRNDGSCLRSSANVVKIGLSRNCSSASRPPGIMSEWASTLC